ncbi:sugar ABC transporter permease [Erysipelothrix sp. HDW6C]|uniref:carbohydrate ABC transporter permease n=1 Tax=Erysipelothrix sp. HDW6C TaxID=2714930 RepID=UPI00140CB0DE|nr:sugar ABC transporter permease [Erysipelothrix sp. HDW6C]QIK69414.1 sugar ABC transporter permease [Erysipelothrix sp. HDW6C]
MKYKKFVWIILIPVFIHMSVFIIGPIFAGVGISFFDYNPLNAHQNFIGMQNYVRLLSDNVFIKAVTNTLFFVAVTVTLNVTISLGIASLINSFRSNKVRSLFRMIFFLPCVAPLVASSVVWSKSILTTTNGLVNIVLRQLGFAGVNWLGDPNILMWSIIVFTLWADIGYNIILFTAGLDGIPADIYEASDIDGASKWQQFIHVTVPLLGRTFAFVLVMTLISHFQMFAQFAVMAVKNGPLNSGVVLTSQIYRTAFEYKDMGYASAISVVLFLIILVVSMVQQKLNKVEWEY